MDNSEINEDQHQIYLWVMKKCGIENEGVAHSYLFEESISEVHTVIESTVAVQQEEIHSLVVLPEMSNQVYIAFTDQQPDLLAELVASLGAQSESNDALHPGYVSTTDSDQLKQAGWYGFCILSPEHIFDSFDRDLPLNDELFEFQIVALLNEAEYDQAIKSGVQCIESAIENGTKVLHHFTPGAGGKARLGKANRKRPTTSQAIAFPDVNAIPDLPELPDFDAVVDQVAPAFEDPVTPPPREKNLKALLNLQGEKQVIGETIMGTFLVIGGLAASYLLFNSSMAATAIFPLLFSGAGIFTLREAYKESKTIEHR